jgi:CBS domain-containing protein
VSATIQPYHGSYLTPSLDHATVADAMHPGILSCDPDASLTDVARMLATHHVHCVAVMGLAHETAGERLVWGIISDLDLLRAGIRGGAETAGALASQPLVSVEMTMPLREAGELMLAHGATHVVVTDPRTLRPVAILSTLDFAGIFAWGEA